MAERCAGSRASQYGIDIVVLENELLRVSILSGKGADVYELRYKPLDADVLVKMPGGLRCFEGRDLSQRRLTWYSELSAGGWQDVLPHRGLWESGGRVFRIEQPSAGAAATVPWRSTLTPLEHEVILDCSLRIPDSPLHVEKRFRLREGTAALEIEEQVRNVGDGAFSFTWTQHPAFGSDLLRGEVVLDVPRCTVFDPARYALEPGAGVRAYEQPFDDVTLSDGSKTSLARVEPLSAAANSNRFYALRGLGEGRAVVFNRTRGFGARLDWDLALFPYLRYWYRNDDRFFALGIEPSNDSFASLDDSLRNGTYTRLEPGHALSTRLRCGIVAGEQGA